ncbi:hypothetical protein NQ317_012231 [Molorchus minor]|uniref:THAP-type domain-containing protein n=1 Tax=Molorchus minor TaxID=1323400 RepID=A0ABQ9IXJ9_9CUCU|nr:hypothetical protein NQ317_012231 [Molorchus minor]
MEENVQKYFKYCLVPLCKSTTVKTPNKIFIRLPLNRSRRTKWLKACQRDIHDISPNSNALHVCQDHFNVSVNRKRASAQSDRITALQGEKGQPIREAVSSASTCTQPLEDQNILGVESNMVSERSNYKDNIQKQKLSMQTFKQTFSMMKSKGVQCNLHNGVSVGLSPPRVLYKHIGTST